MNGSFLSLRDYWPTGISSKGRVSHNSFNLGLDNPGDLKLIRCIMKLRGSADLHLPCSRAPLSSSYQVDSVNQLSELMTIDRSHRTEKVELTAVNLLVPL